jgi:hypothetical protein
MALQVHVLVHEGQMVEPKLAMRRLLDHSWKHWFVAVLAVVVARRLDSFDSGVLMAHSRWLAYLALSLKMLDAHVAVLAHETLQVLAGSDRVVQPETLEVDSSMVKAMATRWPLMLEALVEARNLEHSYYSVRSVAAVRMARLVADH